MSVAKDDPQIATASPDESPAPRYRSGAVARMTGIPVSTLRVWELRYRVVAPPQTDTGHRLYSKVDVERLALLKQLVDQGHAIGSLAALPLARLREVSALHARTRPAPGAALPVPRLASAHSAGGEAAGSARPPLVAVVGRGLARRLRGPAMQRAVLATGLRWAAEYDDLDSAAASSAADTESDTGTAPATAAAAHPRAPTAALLLVQIASLQPESQAGVLALAQRLQAQRVVVFYGFGTERSTQALRDAGVLLRRGPMSDADLGTLLEAALQGLATAPPELPDPGDDAGLPMPVAGVIAPRRFDDEALADITARSPVMACECPRHLAELVTLIAQFETYSGDCENRHPEDAALHDYLHRVAGTARTQFEEALERVARAEGIALPARLAG